MLRSFLLMVYVLAAGLNFLRAQDLNDINLANEYYSLGEIEKASELYEKLARDRRNIALIHSNYFEILLSTAEYDKAEKYIDRVIRENKGNMYYVVDKGIILGRKGLPREETEYFEELAKEIASSDRQVRLAAQYLIRNQKIELAKMLYTEGRKVSGDTYMYALELATVYRLENNIDLMVREYLNFVNHSPNNLPYVKNVLQNYLVETEDLESFEMLLYELVQKDSENDIYTELLIWVNIQLRNFYGAFIQARAYDLRKAADGNEVFEVGLIALENKDYETALQIFDYLTVQYKMAYIYPIAKRYKIKTREELIKNTFPVDVRELRKLTEDYNSLVSEIGINARTAEALLSKANLHAFFLDEKDSAIQILNTIINIPRIPPDLKARCKLDLGDIYMLLDEPWESALLYAQVEKERKETEIGYEAKLRSARLSYFKGEFVLAQEHLDVLKLATTRKIANDAMQLSLMIKDNLAFDTTDTALREYASVELLLFQNKKEEALLRLNELYDTYQGTSLSSYILWLNATLHIEMGKFDMAINLLSKLIEDDPENIMCDDALYKMADTYEFHLKNKEKAQSLYEEFLMKYPGSYFTAEARKRFRKLRGDVVY